MCEPIAKDKAHIIGIIPNDQVDNECQQDEDVQGCIYGTDIGTGRCYDPKEEVPEGQEPLKMIRTMTLECN